MTSAKQRQWLRPTMGLIAVLGLGLLILAACQSQTNSTTAPISQDTASTAFNIVVVLSTDSASGTCIATWEARATQPNVSVNYQVLSPRGMSNGAFFDSVTVGWTVPESLSYKVNWSLSTSFWATQDSFVVAPNTCPGFNQFQ